MAGGSIQLVGPGLLVLIALAVVIWAMSAFVAIDSLRRRRSDYAGVPEGRWFYAIPQVVFFVAFFAWQVPFVQTAAPWIGGLVVAIPFVLAQQMAYLLRVVFPTRKRLELRLAAEQGSEPPADTDDSEDIGCGDDDTSCDPEMDAILSDLEGSIEKPPPPGS